MRVCEVGNHRKDICSVILFIHNSSSIISVLPPNVLLSCGCCNNLLQTGYQFVLKRNLLSPGFGSQKSESKVLARPHPLQSLWGRILPCLLQLLIAVGIPLLPRLLVTPSNLCLYVHIVFTSNSPLCLSFSFSLK